MIQRRVFPLFLSALLTLTLFSSNVTAQEVNAVAGATSHSDDKEEVQQLKQAKITLIDAIQIAEKHTSGKAISASIEDDSATPTFEVEVVKDGKVFEVLIDGIKGTVLKVKEERDD